MCRRWTLRVCTVLQVILAFGLATPSASPQDVNWQQTIPIQTQRYDPPDWNPPNTDSKIRSLDHSAPCDLAAILDRAGKRATEFAGNLERFTAQESINYKRFDPAGDLKVMHSGTFDYTFVFEDHNGGTASQEYRTPTKKTHDFSEAGNDVGEVALVLIFHPSLQADYQMRCEGIDKWRGQRSWVIAFEQRKDRPAKTFRYREEKTTYPAMLKGRAWISTENWQILHLEINLLQVPPGTALQGGTMSVDYGAVPIASGKLTLWLPQRVQTWWEFRDYRTTLIHSFKKFQVFLVETKILP
jgi:hypothetical protein